MTVVMDDFTMLPTERLEAEVATHAAQLAAATCRWLLMIAELDRRGSWSDWQCQSMAQWLSWRCSLDLRTGREHVRVARALEALPRVTAAFARGELSYSKARSLTRIATAETEPDLLEIARSATASQLDRLAGPYAQMRAVATHEGARAQLLRRGFDTIHHDDGTVTIVARRCAPDAAATILAAVESALSEVPFEAETSYAMRQADALEVVARAYVAPDDTKPRPVLAMLSASVTDLDASEPGSLPTLDGLAISIDAARELLCDASYVVAVEQPDGTIAYTRRARSIPTAARREVTEREERRCRWPGCSNTRHLHVHHITWRSKHGNHRTDNLVLLCSHHHRAVHRGGWTIIGDANGELVFRAPDGVRTLRERPPELPAARPDDVRVANARQGIAPDGGALAPAVYSPLELDWVMAVLGGNHFPMN